MLARNVPARVRRLGTDGWAVVALVLVAAILGAVHGEFKDLAVYRYAGRAVLDGSPLDGTRDPAFGLPFTYPPFAALVMVPLALLPDAVLPTVWTAFSAGCLAAAVVVARRALGRPMPGALVVVVAGAALALEPVWQNFAFGQVNTVLMLAVLVDVLHPERRLSGVLVGVAAGVKLTPLVFAVLLLLVGRRGAAGRAALTFVGTVVVGWIVRPGASSSYWGDGLLDADRVGPPSLAHNQSVYGALTRVLDGPPTTAVWLAVAGPIALAILCVGASWWRRGDRVLGTGLAALAMLVASPVSWSHHWVWAVPMALVLWERSRWLAGVWTAVFVARPMLWPPWGSGREYDWNALEHVVGNAYLLAAVAVACWAGLRLRTAQQ